jgi:hypothetical protein
MNRRLLSVAVVVAVVLVAGAFVLPDGPTPGVTGETPADAAGDGGDGGSEGSASTPQITVSGGTGTATATEPFGFTIEEIEQCGNTCRDVTSTVTNQQSTDAADVDVTTDIYAGNETSGDPIWNGQESVGTLPAGESYTATKRVDLGMSDALAIERNDGWITIETTIESDSKTMTVVQHRDVN